MSANAESLERANIHYLDKPVQAENAVQIKLSQIWLNALSIDEVGIDDDFFDLGGTSQKAALIFADIQHEFGQNLKLSRLYNASTIRELAALLDSETVQSQTIEADALPDRLVKMNSAIFGEPLYMIPGSGGNAITLAYIARGLGDDQPAYGLDAIGLAGDSEPLYDQIQIATEHRRAIEQHNSEGPYYLFGSCHGAVTALEVAQQLTKKGKTVAFLGLADPMNLTPPEVKRDASGRASLLARIKFLAEFLNYRRMRMRKQFFRDRIGLRSKRDKRDPQRPYRRMLSKANTYAGRHYVPALYAGPAALFMSSNCPPGRRSEGRLRWAELLTDPGLTTDFIAGTGPSFYCEAENAHEISSKLEARLRAAQAAYQNKAGNN